MKRLLHFLLLGGLLLGLQRLTADWPLLAAKKPIHIGSEQVAAVQAEWQGALGRAPDAAQLQASVRKLADEEMLVQEARRLGLNRSDPVARARLLQNLRFAYPESLQDDERLLEQAVALRLDQRDFVVRRRLIQLMQQRFSVGAELSDEALRDTLAANPERYGSARRVAFRQVFLSADQHPHDLAAAAEALQTRLKTASDADLGEPFLGGSQFGFSSAAEIRKIFGTAVAQAAMAAAPGRWVGPVRSAYGLHFIHVDAVQSAQAPDLEAVRQRASYAALEQLEQGHVEQALIGLRHRYPLVVDAPLEASGAMR
ncbi:MAG: peptidylprolyl isomerase [Pseudomonadota bacterium]